MLQLKKSVFTYIFLILGLGATAQNHVIKGIVLDSATNAPLSAVTVLEKGQKISTSTNEKGEFTISINHEFPTGIQFSFIGYNSKIVTVTGSQLSNVLLSPAVTSLDEVVTVGYGTQKKINLTGSVGSVSGAVMTRRPAPNSATLLQGLVTGLQVTQSTGQPGRDGVSILIRGRGSFGASSAPLILVDGVPGSISYLSPDDIENVTVLKDAASAAIYGARAANGVILVTTRKGKKGPSIFEYKLDVNRQVATRLPDFIYNSAEYMQMWNDARKRRGAAPVYTQAQIDAYKNATDQLEYPNFNWVDAFFKPATATSHHLGMSGGNEKTTYNVSMSYLNQDGIIASHSLKRYNALLNLTSQVNKFITMGTNVNMTYRNISEPWQTNDALVLVIYHGSPTYGPYLPDGSGRPASRAYSNEPIGQRNPAVVLNDGGQYTKQYGINAQAYIDVNLYKGLTWQIKGAANYNDETYKSHQYQVPAYIYHKAANATDYTYDNDGYPTSLGVTDSYSKNITQTLFSTLTYDTRIGVGHNLKGMLGYEQQSYVTQGLNGRRIQFPVNNLMELDAGAADGQSTGGNSSEWGLQSLFGRVNYDYKGKYMLEANARYDGTSRVAADHRWGFFPAVSAGWRISEEHFLRNNVSWIDNAKLRASIGTLGNQEIGLYPYQDILSLTGYPFGATVDQGVLLTRLTDKNLRWETTKVTDIGMDFDIYKDLLGVTVDWFNKKTTGILTTQPVPGSLGLSGPVTNDGELENKGWEVELRHRNRIGDFTYGASALFSTYRNKLLKIRTPTKGVNEVGLPYGSYYMYEWDGIFQSQEEIDKSPKQVFFPPKPGDLKIKDQNGDGVVNADDRITVKGAYPEFMYSFRLDVGWKGFNLSAFFQGVQGRKLNVTGWGVDPFIQGTPPTTKFRDAWTPENHSTTVPAIYESGYGGVSAYASTYYLQNASYLRLKNLYLSYAFSKQVLDRIRLKGLMLYISGDNLLTFTKYEGADPERTDGGRFAQYPQLRIMNAGLDVKF